VWSWEAEAKKVEEAKETKEKLPPRRERGHAGGKQARKRGGRDDTKTRTLASQECGTLEFWASFPR